MQRRAALLRLGGRSAGLWLPSRPVLLYVQTIQRFAGRHVDSWLAFWSAPCTSSGDRP